MHAEVDTETASSSTGATAPPHPHRVDWRGALPGAGLVAAIGAVLTVIGLKVPLASLVSTLWVMGGSVMALGLYGRRRPRAWMDARTGLRIGAVTGLLMIAMMGVALASTGAVARFGAHGMQSFDAQATQQFATMQSQMTARMQEQKQSADFQTKVLEFVGSQEVHGGLALLYLAVLGGFILLLSAGGGAFAGMLRARGRGAESHS